MFADPLRRIEGKYEILEKLKEGGMGAIYKVRHRLLDEVRVVKLMRPQLTEDTDLKARFVREARFAIKLRHPNVAQLYDFTVDEEDGTAYIVMEFIDGLTLEEILAANGPPPLGLTLEMAQQSLRALGYLHGKGFIHRDISPDNLILTGGADGEPLVKLIDLGIAKTLGAGGEGLTQTGTFLGKVRYASPEQFGAEGGTHVDGRGDLYSFGIVLYELLTGRNPILGRDPSSLIAAHLFRPPLDFAESDPEGRVPPGLREVVLQALAKSPADRFPTAQDFSRTLAAFRSPADLDELNLRRILRRSAAASGTVSPAPVGSTQERLDRQFAPETTPSRGGYLETTPTVPRQPEEPAALREAAAKIERQLQSNDLRVAATQILQAVEVFGERPELQTLQDRLEGLRLRQAEIEAEGLVAEARQRLAAADFAGAIESLEQARSLDPENPEMAPLRAEVEAGAERRRQEEEAAAERARQEAEARRRAEEQARRRAAEEEARRRAEEEERRRAEEEERSRVEEEARRQAQEEERRAARLADTVATIHACLERDELDQASSLLDQAVVQFGGGEPLRAQWQQLEDKKRRAAELASAAAALASLLDRGEIEEAEPRLAAAVAAHGERGPLPALRARLEEMRDLRERERAVRGETLVLRRSQEDLEAVWEATQTIAELLARRETGTALSALHDATTRFGEREEFQKLRKQLADVVLDDPPPAPTPTAPPVPPEASRPREAAPEPLFSRPISAPSRPAPRRPPGILLAVAAGLVLVLGLGSWLLFHKPAVTPETATSPSAVQEPAPSTAVAVAPGTLLLDAVPWGEVVEIADREGRAQPLGAQRFTPLTLSLPPGHYRVTLRNPNFPRPVAVDAEVLSGGAVKSIAELGRIDEQELLHALGW